MNFKCIPAFYNPLSLQLRRSSHHSIRISDPSSSSYTFSYQRGHFDVVSFLDTMPHAPTSVFFSCTHTLRTYKNFTTHYKVYLSLGGIPALQTSPRAADWLTSTRKFPEDVDFTNLPPRLRLVSSPLFDGEPRF